MTNLSKFISEVRGRIEKATPGPWETRCPDTLDNHALPNWVWCEFGWVAMANNLPRAHSIPNAEFISASRVDLPKAIAALEAACEALSTSIYSSMSGEGNGESIARDALAHIEEILK